MRIPSHRQGFTLVELLIVISIITILSSLVTVSVQYAVARSREVSTASR